jgi:hypothetical protein
MWIFSNETCDVVRIEKMKVCPCGLTREELLAAPNQLLGRGGVCIAEYADESLNDDETPKICNRPLGAHPHAPPGKNIFLFTFNSCMMTAQFQQPQPQPGEEERGKKRKKISEDRSSGKQERSTSHSRSDNGPSRLKKELHRAKDLRLPVHCVFHEHTSPVPRCIDLTKETNPIDLITKLGEASRSEIWEKIFGESLPAYASTDYKDYEIPLDQDKLAQLRESVYQAQLSSLLRGGQPDSLKSSGLQEMGSAENSLENELPPKSEPRTYNTVIDTHNSPNGLPLFMCPQDGRFSMTAKPDLTMKNFPAFLELKCANASPAVYTDDLDGLHQGLDRVMTTTSLAAYISKLVVFVMTGVRCYVLVFKREINDGKDLMTETMSLDRVSFETLRALWAQLSRYGTDHPDCHLTSDGAILLSTLRACGYPPGYCRTQFLDKSNSSIYSVTIPTCQGQRGIFVDAAKKDLAIKIITRQDKFEVESRCLRQIASKIPELKGHFLQDSPYASFQFYALGHYRDDEQRLEWYGQQKPDHLSPCQIEDQTVSTWWSPAFAPALAPPHGRIGGAILMRVGSHVADDEIHKAELSQILKGALVSFHFSHGASIVHRDIRRNNLMKFGESWQLIDFDMACFQGDPVTLYCDDNQFKKAGPAVLKLRPERLEDYKWTTADDYEMLSTLIDSLTSRLL